MDLTYFFLPEQNSIKFDFAGETSIVYNFRKIQKEDTENFQNIHVPYLSKRNAHGVFDSPLVKNNLNLNFPSYKIDFLSFYAAYLVDIDEKTTEREVLAALYYFVFAEDGMYLFKEFFNKQQKRIENLTKIEFTLLPFENVIKFIERAKIELDGYFLEEKDLKSMTIFSYKEIYNSPQFLGIHKFLKKYVEDGMFNLKDDNEIFNEIYYNLSSEDKKKFDYINNFKFSFIKENSMFQVYPYKEIGPLGEIYLIEFYPIYNEVYISEFLVV